MRKIFWEFHVFNMLIPPNSFISDARKMKYVVNIFSLGKKNFHILISEVIFKFFFGICRKAKKFFFAFPRKIYSLSCADFPKLIQSFL